MIMFVDANQIVAFVPIPARIIRQSPTGKLAIQQHNLDKILRLDSLEKSKKTRREIFLET